MDEDFECLEGETVKPGDPVRCTDEAAKAEQTCDANNASGERDCAAERQTALDACTRHPAPRQRPSSPRCAAR
jgi:hypothetical protein